MVNSLKDGWANLGGCGMRPTCPGGAPLPGGAPRCVVATRSLSLFTHSSEGLLDAETKVMFRTQNSLGQAGYRGDTRGAGAAGLHATSNRRSQADGAAVALLRGGEGCERTLKPPQQETHTTVSHASTVGTQRSSATAQASSRQHHLPATPCHHLPATLGPPPLIPA